MLEPIVFPRNRHDMNVMQQPVQQRRRQGGVLRERGVPLSERQVAGNDQAPSFVLSGDHLEEQVGLLPVHRQVANFVNDQ